MRVGLGLAVCISLVFATVLATPENLRAADMAERATVVHPEQSDQIRDYIRKRAMLYVIRATFDVVSVDDIPLLLAEDVRDAQGDGLTQAELSSVDTALVAEGSYFIVSISYLIDSGYPAWPEDRSAATYRNDALAVLRPLAGELIASVSANQDCLIVFQTAAEVYGWTEGNVGPPGKKANFLAAESLVDRAINAHEPASTKV